METSKNPPKAATSATQVAYLRLDPILRTLLNLITQYREQTETNNDNEQHIVGLLRAQTKILDQLQQTIQELDRPSLIVLAQYLSLPLLAILHATSISIGETETDTETETETETTTSTTTIKNNRKSLVRWSEIRTLQQATAQTIQCYVEICGGTSAPPNNHNHNSTTLSVSLPHAHIVKFLIALETAVPSLGQQQQDQEKTQIISQMSLEDGSACRLAILQAIHVISLQLQTSSRLADNVAAALDGALVARLAEACSDSLLLYTHKSPEQLSLSLQALDTLSSLMTGISDHKLWQRIFPGIFTSLYRFLVLQARRRNNSLPEFLECQGLKTLISLLCLTLIPPARKETVRVATPASVLLQLQSLALVENKGATTDTATPSTPSPTSFLDHINLRLVTPLYTLLHQVLLSPYSKVRLEATNLCRMLLVETRPCWKDPKLPDLALECCLVLEQDSQESVSSHAKEVLEEYQHHLGTSDASSWIVPRIVAMMDELPTVAQGKKEIEIRTRLKLITGYLALLASSRKGSSALASSATRIIEALKTVFDIDFDSLSTATFAAAIVGGPPPTPRFRHFLGYETATLATGMLQTLGEALGIKHAAIIVDSCIADFYEACLSRIDAQQQMSGSGQAEWLHAWLGGLVVAQEVMAGAFSPPDATCELEGQAEKKERKRIKVLKTLASSILPIMVSSCLWNLPTKSEQEQISDGSNSSTNHEVSLMSTMTPTALKGNASAICLLLEIISLSCSLFQEDIEAFLSVILLPTVEKAASNNVPMIRAAANRVLVHMANACGFPGTDELINQQLQSLMGGMSGRLRIPGGKIAPQAAQFDNVLSVSSMIRFVLESIAQRPTDRDVPEGQHEWVVSHILELVSLLMERFDHFILKKAIGEPIMLELTSVCHSSFQYLLSGYGANDDAVYTYRIRGSELANQESPGPWLELLEDFRISPIESFSASQNSSDGDRADESDRNQQPYATSQAEIDFVSRLMPRCCYFLSNHSLKVKIASCDAMISGFRFLAFVACLKKNFVDKEETDEIGTSILRQVGSSWPAIKARLISTSDEIIFSQRAKSVVVLRPQHVQSSSPNQELAVHRMFLAKLTSLIAAMSEGSGEFITDRFKNEVWPVISMQLACLVDKQDRTNRLLESSQEKRWNVILVTKSNAVMTTFQDSEKSLLLAIMDLLARVFRIPDCGKALAGLVPSIGAVILPFLDNDEKVSALTLEALKIIAAVDCDALWRPVLHLSGRGIPSCPLNSSKPKLTTLKKPGSLFQPLAAKATELVEYIETLSEQAL